MMAEEWSWWGLWMRNPGGGLEGGAEVLEEGYFCFCETNLFVEVMLGVVVMVE